VSERVVDKQGFVREGESIILYLPAWEGIIPFRVIARMNKDAETLNYGPFPYTHAGYPTGVVPGGVTTAPTKFKDITGAYPPERAVDMFFYKEPSMLIHAFVDIRPHLFRIYQWIPTGAKQIRLFRIVTWEPTLAVPTNIFAYSVGVKEQFFLPNFHIDWQLLNGTNMDLRTYTVFKYAEYEVEILKDPATIFNMIQRKVPAYWYTFPVMQKFDEGERMLKEVYKITPIPLYKSHELDRAVREIPTLLREARI